MTNLHHIASALIAFLSMAIPSAALADPGDTSEAGGDADVSVVEPLQIEPLEDLRFGSFFQPLAATTVTVAPNGSVSNTVEVSDLSGPQGPARFTVRGDASRFFFVFLPPSSSISNGSSSMTIDRYRANALFNLIGRFDGNGEYDLTVGGRLNVDAAQEPGEYSGVFELTVLYL